VEEALVGCGLLVCLLKVNSGDLGGADGGAVERDGANSGSGGALVGERLGELDVQDTRRADTPGVAEDTILVAVQVGEVRRVGGGGEESHAAVEGLLRTLA